MGSESGVITLSDNAPSNCSPANAPGCYTVILGAHFPTQAGVVESGSGVNAGSRTRSLARE